MYRPLSNYAICVFVKCHHEIAKHNPDCARCQLSNRKHWEIYNKYHILLFRRNTITHWESNTGYAQSVAKQPLPFVRTPVLAVYHCFTCWFSLLYTKCKGKTCSVHRSNKFWKKILLRGCELKSGS